MSLKRSRGWRGRLAGTISAHRRNRFAWGQHDCGLLAADCIRAMTGEDLAAGFRGRYRTQGEAAEVLRAAGCADVADLASRHLAEVDRARASVGDVVLVEADGCGSLGVVVGEQIAVYGSRGIGFLPLERARRAWRVG